MRPGRRRVAFVVDRYAPSIYAGAPRYAHALARALGTRFDTELLTTCAGDAVRWPNAFPAGLDEEGGVRIRRFAVDVERDMPRFDRLSRALVRRPRAPLAGQERWMGEQGPLALDLLRHLARERDAYDAFVFVSYLYATTYFGLPLVADRAVFVPLVHDEWMLRLSMWDRIFGLPRGFVYNTPEERALAAARFPQLGITGPVIGVGVQPDAQADAGRFRARFGIDGPFALYLGRVDAAKGCDALIRAVRRGRPARRLVLVGERRLDVHDGDGVIVTGPVDERTKWDALAACDLLVLPSRYESLSIVALEAWAAGKPVVGNVRAAAVAGQIGRSGGGVTYGGERDLLRALALDGGRAVALGAAGRAYVEANYRWPVIAQRFGDHLAATLRWDDQA